MRPASLTEDLNSGSCVRGVQEAITTRLSSCSLMSCWSRAQVVHRASSTGPRRRSSTCWERCASTRRPPGRPRRRRCSSRSRRRTRRRAACLAHDDSPQRLQPRTTGRLSGRRRWPARRTRRCRSVPSSLTAEVDPLHVLVSSGAVERIGLARRSRARRARRRARLRQLRVSVSPRARPVERTSELRPPRTLRLAALELLVADSGGSSWPRDPPRRPRARRALTWRTPASIGLLVEAPEALAVGLELNVEDDRLHGSGSCSFVMIVCLAATMQQTFEQ